MALVIILVRAGLDLDPTALKRLKFIVMRLSLVPWCVEAGAVAVLSRYLLDLPWKFASLLGKLKVGDKKGLVKWQSFYRCHHCSRGSSSDSTESLPS